MNYALAGAVLRRFLHSSKRQELTYHLPPPSLHNFDTCCLPAILNSAFLADYSASNMTDLLFADSCIGIVIYIGFTHNYYNDR